MLFIDQVAYNHTSLIFYNCVNNTFTAYFCARFSGDNLVRYETLSGSICCWNWKEFQKGSHCNSLEPLFCVFISWSRFFQDYLDTLKGNLTVWPFVQFVNFSFVPIQFRLLRLKMVCFIGSNVIFSGFSLAILSRYSGMPMFRILSIANRSPCLLNELAIQARKNLTYGTLHNYQKRNCFYILSIFLQIKFSDFSVGIFLCCLSVVMGISDIEWKL